MVLAAVIGSRTSGRLALDAHSANERRESVAAAAAATQSLPFARPSALPDFRDSRIEATMVQHWSANL
ncbi:hypothetical protein EAH76_08205 [Sphingomonas glacialis]|uniref:Uncharacterized protein n=1 Tax=Sphingomonas glacialis TaxID=658225 RepID=A0A502FZ39_9SPHN|nr:hypothetical protein EAH76_08205 [Sphingomonas glacialis]